MRGVHMEDRHDVGTIEITIRDNKLWVNIDGQCALRVYRFAKVVTDTFTHSHMDVEECND